MSTFNSLARSLESVASSFQLWLSLTQVLRAKAKCMGHC